MVYTMLQQNRNLQHVLNNNSVYKEREKLSPPPVKRCSQTPKHLQALNKGAMINKNTTTFEKTPLISITSGYTSKVP